jgi:IS4 transposase
VCAYLDWRGTAQVFRLTRERTEGGKTKAEVVHGITSRLRDRCDAGRLLELTRAHWGIENGLHLVRDVTCGEDQCRVRKGAAPQVLAAVRNAALFLLRLTAPKNLAAAMRRLAARPGDAVALVGRGREN